MSLSTDDPSFDELDAEMGALEESGVPEEFQAAFRKLRKELANKREKYQPLAEAFDGLSDGDRQYFLTVAGTLKVDQAAALQMLVDGSQYLAESVGADWNEVAGVKATADETAETPAEEPEVTEEKTTEQLIEERVLAILEEREKAAEVTRLQQQIGDKLKALGYADPSSFEAQQVLLRAKFIEDADSVLDAIQLAHEAVAVPTAAADTAADADTAAPSDEGSQADLPPSEDTRGPMTMREMNEAAKARIASAFEQPITEDAGV